MGSFTDRRHLFYRARDSRYYRQPNRRARVYRRRFLSIFESGTCWNFSRLVNKNQIINNNLGGVKEIRIDSNVVELKRGPDED